MNMDYEEFTGWCAYFSLRPVGWRDDSRTHMLMSTWGLKEPGHKIFTSLETMRQGNQERTTHFQNLKNSMFFQMLLGAKGGDQLELLK
jgi:hypothetical protein